MDSKVLAKLIRSECERNGDNCFSCHVGHKQCTKIFGNKNPEDLTIKEIEDKLKEYEEEI